MGIEGLTAEVQRALRKGFFIKKYSELCVLCRLRGEQSEAF
jgi:hypothetical protein